MNDALTEPFLELIDSGEKRADLAKRREVKFAFNGVDVGTLRSVLRTSCRSLIYHKKVSVVRSVYFDDARLSAAFANINGVSSRRKLRIRWYDSLLPIHDVFCEVKWRQNRLTGKHRFQLKSKLALAEVDYADIVAQLFQVIPREFHGYLEKYWDPVVLVEYQREHFGSLDGAARMTLDYDVKFYDQAGKRRISAEFPVGSNDLVVVEGKITPGLEEEIQSVLYPLPLRIGRCSKYVHGCQALGRVGQI